MGAIGRWLSVQCCMIYMVNYKQSTQPPESGFALIMALVISSVVLSIGLSMLSITIKQVDLTATARESEVAFQTASAAMECALMTRIKEDINIATTSPADNISIDCGTISGTISRSGNDNRGRYIYETDWVGSDGRVSFVKIDMFVIGENAGNRNYNPSDRSFSRICPDDIYCTYIFAEGYNRSEDEVLNAALFTVQRELTAEF